MTNVLVDTNMLVYSVQAEAAGRHIIAKEALWALIDAKRISISTQNLAEFCRVMLEKSPKKQAAEDVEKSVSGFSKFASVLQYNGATVLRAVSLSSQYGIHFFDALIAATMQENGIAEILTENTEDFSKIPWIKARNPFK